MKKPVFAAFWAGVAALMSGCAQGEFDCQAQGLEAVIWAQIKVQKRFREPASTQWDTNAGRGEMLTAEPCVWKVYGQGRTRNGVGGMNRVMFSAVVTYGADNRPGPVTQIDIAEQ